MPHLVLVTSDGVSLGPFEVDELDAPIIWRGRGEPDLRAVDRIDSDDPEEFGTLVVEPLA